MKTRILACFIQCIILKLMTKPVPELQEMVHFFCTIINFSVQAMRSQSF